MDPYVFGGALWGTLYSSAHAVTRCADDECLPALCTALCVLLRALRTCLPCEACRGTYDAHMQACHGAQGRDGVYTTPRALLAAERAARAAGRPRADPAAAYPALHCIVRLDSVVRRKLGTGDNGGTLRVARRVAALGGGYGGAHDVVYVLALMATHAADCVDAAVRARRARATCKFARSVCILLQRVDKYAPLSAALHEAFPSAVPRSDASDAQRVVRRVHAAWCAMHGVAHTAQCVEAADLTRRVELARGKLRDMPACYARDAVPGQ